MTAAVEAASAILQEYDDAIKSGSNAGLESTRALVHRGLLLHKLRKGSVSACLSGNNCGHTAPCYRRLNSLTSCLQFEREAQQLWQRALDTASPITDAWLIVQAHKLLHVPGAIASQLNLAAPQQDARQDVGKPSTNTQVASQLHNPNNIFRHDTHMHVTLQKGT